MVLNRPEPGNPVSFRVGIGQFSNADLASQRPIRAILEQLSGIGNCAVQGANSDQIGEGTKIYALSHISISQGLNMVVSTD